MSLRVTSDEYLTLLARTGNAESVTHHPKASKPNKYRAVRKEVDGHVFDSIAEGRRYIFLRDRLLRGEIETLMLQYEFPFYVKDQHIFTYVADFVYFENNRRVIEDVKGYKLPMYKLKKKCIEAEYGIKITEIRRHK